MAITKIVVPDGQYVQLWNIGNTNKGTISMSDTTVNIRGTGYDVNIADGNNLIFEGATHTIGGTNSIITIGKSGDTIDLTATGVTFLFPTLPYLPLTGGTVSGALYIGGETLSINSNHTNADAYLYLRSRNSGNTTDWDPYIRTDKTNARLEISDGLSIIDGDLNYGLSQKPSLTLGINTTKAGTIKLWGGTSSAYGLIHETGTNLHLDTNASIYLNYYKGTSVVFGNGASNIAASMDSSGQLWNGSTIGAGNKYWHAGNDGNGSGLDADLLEGYHANVSATVDTIALRDSSGNLSISNTLNFNGGTGFAIKDESGTWYQKIATADITDLSVHRFTFSERQGTDPYIELFGVDGNGELYAKGNKVWHAGNDGTGSGLDADLLEGYHASQTVGAANTIVVRNSNGYIMNTWFNSNRAAETSAAESYIYDSGDGYLRKKTLANVRTELGGSGKGLDADTLDTKHATDFALAAHSHAIIIYQDTRATDFTPFTYPGLSVHMKTNTTDSLADGGTYHGIINIQHWSDSSGGTSHQLGFTDNGNMYVRTSDTAGTGWSGWQKVLTDTNTKTSSYIKSDTAPTDTEALWIDTTNGTMKYHNGTAWVPIKAVWG